jgi:hypothetical protein
MPYRGRALITQLHDNGFKQDCPLEKSYNTANE